MNPVGLFDQGMCCKQLTNATQELFTSAVMVQTPKIVDESAPLIRQKP